MFYLTTHSTHFIYGYMEGNVSFNDALNTFYLRLYGVRHIVNDQSDSERKPAAATWATICDRQQGFFLYASSHRQDNIYHGLCYTSRGAVAETR